MKYLFIFGIEEIISGLQKYKIILNYKLHIFYLNVLYLQRKIILKFYYFYATQKNYLLKTSILLYIIENICITALADNTTL